VDATGRDETAGSATAVTDASPTSDGAGTSSVAATTIPLSPSAEADLPEAAPGETVAPSTTTPGPLPVPDIDLLEVGELQRPTELTTRPRDDRAFVVEQAGRVIALDDLSTEPVLDISDRVQDRGNEQGLLGLAFHPTDDLAYVDYTGDDGDTVIAEFAVDPRTGVFDEGSERVVMTVDQPYSNHNGGQLVFGPDGLLYIGLGDGGAGGDPERRALDLSSRLGKILRIDPRQDGDEPFTVPADNPFVGRDGADPTVWSFGLRNPWRFSFDPVTGDLWIADVGQDQFEEVDHAPATDGVGAGRGLSFGWSAFEGNARYNEDQPAEGHVPPVVVYSHEDGNCSISGGVVARDSVVPDLDGWYLYGDYCSGRIWGYDTTRQADDPEVVELASLPTLATLAAGPAGDVYAVANDGRVMLVVPA
jgi:glucose/arabinose dehydrogenase